MISLSPEPSLAYGKRWFLDLVQEIHCTQWLISCCPRRCRRAQRDPLFCTHGGAMVSESGSKSTMLMSIAHSAHKLCSIMSTRARARDRLRLKKRWMPSPVSLDTGVMLSMLPLLVRRHWRSSNYLHLDRGCKDMIDG